MKTVKCGPGVDVCTEAVGAVESSKCHPVVPDYLFPTPPVWLCLLRDLSDFGHAFPFQPSPRPCSTDSPFFLWA